MSGDLRWATCALVSVVPNEWIKILIAGTWQGYHRGPLTITPQDLRDIVANFKAGWRTPVPFDYEHQSVFARDNGQPAPASGWGMELETRGDGDTELWCKVEWTPRATSHVQNQEYKFVSSTPVWGVKDPKTGRPLGCVLHSVALTNHPFLRELPAVALSDLNPQEVPLNYKLLLLSLLLLPEAATDPEIAAAHTDAEAGRKQLNTALGLPETAPLAETRAAIQRGRIALDVGRAALAHLKLGDNPTSEAALAALRPTLEHAGFVPAAEVAALRAELGKGKADQLVRQALSDGKVVPATETWFRGFAERDLAGAAAWLSSAPKVFPGQAGDRQDPGGAATLSADEHVIVKALGVTVEDFLKQKKEAGHGRNV